MGFPGGASGEEPTCKAGDIRDGVSIPGSEDPWRRTQQQCSCLENPMDRGAWWATVQGSQSRTQLKQLSVHAQNNIICKKKNKTKDLLCCTHAVTQYSKSAMCENCLVISNYL